MNTTAKLSRDRLMNVKLWQAVRREFNLSPQELNVAILLVLGHTTSQIARKLDIGKGTVVTYYHRLKRKTGTKQRCELVTALWLASGKLLVD